MRYKFLFKEGPTVQASLILTLDKARITDVELAKIVYDLELRFNTIPQGYTGPRYRLHIDQLPDATETK